MRHLLPVVLLCACGGNETQISNLTPEIAVSPSTLDFGEVVVDVETPTLELFVSNGGRADLEVALSIEDPAFSVVGETSFVIKPDGSVTIPVIFDPTELRSYEANLVLATNDPDDSGITAVPLLGIGRVPYAPDIELRTVDGSPTSVLDFGEVDASGADEVFLVANTGDAVLELGSVTQRGAGAFSLASGDPSDTRIAPGQSIAVVVHYESPVPSGDSGEIEIESNDPDEDRAILQLEANGGGEGDYPVAAIDCAEIVDLSGPVVVPFDGSGSSDPLGEPIAAYTWSLTRHPDGVDPGRTVAPPDGPETTLLVDAVGTWEVSLVVTSAGGLNSVPDKCTFDAVSLDDLHVELSWSGATSDLDLHLAADGAELFTVPGDVSWCNEQADWGAPGVSTDDGHLDLDDESGYGPEHAGIDVPADGTYVVRVHHFDDGEDGDVTATVSVFARNALVWSGSEILARNEVWDVGQVNWPDGTFGTYEADPWDAMGVRECR